MCLSSLVAERLAPPIRRVVTHLVPTTEACGESRWPLTTPFCHSLNRVGSVA